MSAQFVRRGLRQRACLFERVSTWSGHSSRCAYRPIWQSGPKLCVRTASLWTRQGRVHPYFPLPSARCPTRSYTTRGRRSFGRGNALSPEQLQVLLRLAGRLLGGMARVIRARGIHKSAPAIAAGLVLIPTGLGTVFVVSHLEEAPLTHRMQLVFVDEEQEMELGAMAASQVYKEEKNAILTASAPETLLVHDVAVELLRSLQQCVKGQSGILAETTEQKERLEARIADRHWEVSVIDSDVVNAFVLPSGNIFVYTGLLEHVQTRGGLAFILGHEVAHALARHSVEKIGVLCLGSFFLDFTAGFLGASSHRYIQYTVLPYLQALVIDMPFSRTLETEADKLGMELMALAGYDPQEAVEVWKRMEDGAQGGSGKNSQVGLPEFLSTHPSHQNRINRLQAQVPAARALQQQALRLKKEKGERIPDGTQSILLPSRVRQKVISPKDALLQGRRREASAQTAMRASNLVGAALERESRA